jgi:hypothetical protein
MPESAAKKTKTQRTGDLIHPRNDGRDRSPARPSRLKRSPPKPAGWVAYLCLIVLTIGCYLPIFQSDIIWSSYDRVERSPFQSMEHWTDAWTLDMIRSEDSITLSSYFFEQALPLPPSAAHHAINLALHLIAAILLLKLLDTLKLPAAFSASLIFALHPSVLQPLFWSGYRSELIGLILILVALIFGIRNSGARDFIGLVIVSALAYLQHPASLVIPLVLMICIFYQKPTFHLKDYNRLLPLLGLTLFIGVWIQGSENGAELSIGDRFGLYAQNMFFHLKQALLPVDLALFHPFNAYDSYKSGTQYSALPFILFLPFYILIAFNYKKSWARGILLGLTAYLLCSIYGLAQTGAFIDGRLAHEDHQIYIALPMLIALVVCCFGGIAYNMGQSGRILWGIGLMLFVTFQLSLTASFAHAVSQREQLWHSLSKQWPDSWLPKLALIHAIQDSQGESQLLSQNQIIDTLLEILANEPTLINERILLARTYREVEQTTNALREYRRLLREPNLDNDFLLEAANFYDQLGLNWDANNARERITHSSNPSQ